jgi:foldase protein PrsA
MIKTIRLILSLVAVLATAAIVAGCGGVPGNAVAEVDGTAIEKASFDHWLNIVAKRSGQPNTQVPKPPDYAACVSQKRKTAAAPAKGQPKPNDAQFKGQCEQEYEALRNQAMSVLISFEWIEGEAEEMGINVTDAEVRKQFEAQKKQSFPKEADYQKYLKDSGQTNEDILLQVKLDALSTKIQERVTKGKDKVTDAQAKAYYDKNKARFAQPERRDLRIVLTKTKARADQARRALERGQSWRAVARRYSTDQATKNQGGKLPGVAKGQQEKALDDAVFGARRGRLSGPVKTQFGYYVFEVTKATKASQQSLAEATPTIKQLLASENQQKALQTFVTQFRKDWREKTECREGYATPDCKNGPKATPTPAAGAQGAPTPEGQ